MTKSVIRNLFSLLELVGAIYLLSIFLFLIFYLLPFSPLAHLAIKITQIAPTAGLSSETQALLESQWGLHEPFLKRFLTFHSHLAQGNLGHSVWSGEAVMSLFISRCSPSLLLGGMSFLIAGSLSLFWSWREIRTRHPLLRNLLSAQEMILLCTPPFAMAIFVQRFFFEVPSLLLAGGIYVLTSLPYLTFILSSRVREELQKSYVRTALAQGSDLNRILKQSLLKPALGVLISFLPAWWSLYWATSLVVEPLFRISGIGLLTFEAYRNQDGPLLLGISLLLGTGRLILGWIRDRFLVFWVSPFLDKSTI